MAFISEREKKRVVDYERDAVMTLGGIKRLRVGASRSPRIGFVVNWQGREIEVIADEFWKDPEYSGGPSIKTYYISHCYYEPALRPFRDEIIAMVTEALEAYGGGVME